MNKLKKYIRLKKSRAGLIYLITVLIMLMMPTIMQIVRKNTQISLVLVNAIIVISEGIPALVYLLLKRKTNSIKPQIKKEPAENITIYIILGIVTMPIIMLANMFSQFMSKNVIIENMQVITKQPFVIIILIYGVLTPIVEELIFRGAIYQALKEKMNVKYAIIWSAVLFGLYHMNINQIIYAIVAGVVFAVVTEISHNLPASIIMHSEVNIINIIILYLTKNEVIVENGNEMQSIIIQGVMFALFSIPCIVLINKLLKRLIYNKNYEIRNLFCYSVSKWEDLKQSLIMVFTFSMITAFVIVSYLSYMVSLKYMK